MKRQPYPTDVEDNEWVVPAELVPAPAKTGRPRQHSYREIINAVFYVLSNGIKWRALPHDLPHWKTVYGYFRKWRVTGQWQKWHTTLRSPPYLLTALIDRPQRLVYLSSSMHCGGRASLSEMDWSGRGVTGSYSDSKLFVTALAMAVARLWPEVLSNAVDPGWVPTKMGGAGAPDDLWLGHLTQKWLATGEDPEARTSGGYWYHQRRADPHPAVHDQRFQDELLDTLAHFTAIPSTESRPKERSCAEQ